jgi:hypothetical protein
LWDISGVLLLNILNFSQKNIFESKFCSPFIKDPIKGTTKNVKMSTKSSQSAQNRFLDDILADNPGTK